ncbi:hypothetical protein D3C72_2079510 [compost metagenome]
MQIEIMRITLRAFNHLRGKIPVLFVHSNDVLADPVHAADTLDLVDALQLQPGIYRFAGVVHYCNLGTRLVNDLPRLRILRTACRHSQHKRCAQHHQPRPAQAPAC